MKPTKEQLLDWMLSNNITIRFDSPMTWVKPDGTRFNSCWSVNTPTTQFATLESAEETLYEAYKSWHSYPEYRNIK